MSDATPDRELIPPEMTSQERQLINLLRESPFSKNPGTDDFRIEISHEARAAVLQGRGLLPPRRSRQA